jgi:hypothetical protein
LTASYLKNPYLLQGMIAWEKENPGFSFFSKKELEGLHFALKNP